MTRANGLRRILAWVVAPLIVGMAPAAGWAGWWWDDDDGEEIPFEEANIFFELNDTDGDLGIHGILDGDAWKRVSIEDPNEHRMLTLFLSGRLRRQGLTELFFESDEPSFDELAPEEFFDRFPAGTYEIEGLTLDGEELESEVEVTHLIPAPPEDIQVNGEDAAEDCDAELPSVTPPVVLSWTEVEETHPDLGAMGDLEIAKYEVVVEREEPELLVLSVDLPPGTTSFEIPTDFTDLDSGDGFKFEILVQEESGNRTAVESCFELD